MGWGYGVNNEGREVGYTVEAICDQDGCDKEIDRGLAYVCGSMHDGGEHGCGRYFCYPHLYVDMSGTTNEQLCPSCSDALDLTGESRPAPGRQRGGRGGLS